MSPQILLFTRTTGYRHEAIGAGVELVTAMAERDGVAVDHTEDPGRFTEDALRRYDAVVWLHASGDVLDDAGRAAFSAWLRAGGGFAGIHAAADAEEGWPEFEEIVGARFLSHPKAIQTAAVVREVADDPSTRAVPERWAWEDEWYAFRSDPRLRSTILLSVDETTYDAEDHPMGEGHPISWRGTHGAGATWYTALGHRPEAYGDDTFRAHVWGGITSVFR